MVDSKLKIKLKQYYLKGFPCDKLCRWLSDDENLICKREFTMTFLNGAYLRFKSIRNASELREQLVRELPIKLDIGAEYSGKLWLHKTIGSGVVVPEKKEFIIDIDINEYDDYRTCCKGGSICMKCWKIISIGVKVIENCLKEDFGFQKILWVFSGRRGIHGWVSDDVAKKLNSNERKAIIGYLDSQILNVINERNNSKKKEIKNKSYLEHPHIVRSLKIIKDGGFLDILKEQKVIDYKNEKLLQLISEKEILKIKNDIDNLKEINEIKLPVNILNLFIIYIGYPRIDKEVSIQLGHLLKSPFCIHPKTLNICVPISIDQIDSFDPLKVPNLQNYIENPAILDPYLFFFSKYLEKIST